MKTASNVFSVIGMVSAGILMISSMMTQRAGGYIALYVVLFILSITFGLVELSSSRKEVWIGVCSLLFVNVLSGIFYLCWDGE